MIKTLATFGGSDPMAVLLGDAENGWSGIFGMDLLKWDTRGNLEVLPIQWPNYQQRQVGFQGYVDGKFILGSAQPGGCILAGQADESGIIDLGTVDSSSGDHADRYSTYTPAGKGLFTATFADPFNLKPNPKPQCVFDLLFLEPGKSWYCTRVSFPSMFPIGDTASSYRNVCCALGPTGILNVYSEADSSGQLALLEVLIVEGTLVVKSFNETWIPRDQGNLENPLSPCGEWAQLTVVEDEINQRTLLAYQQFKDIKNTGSFGQPVFYSRWTIVEHKPGLPPRSLGMTEGYGLHRAGQKVFMVPMANGAVYVGLPFYNPTTNASEGWRFATLEGGIFHWTKDALPHGDLMAHGPDGGGVFFDRGTYLKQLVQIIP